MGRIVEYKVISAVRAKSIEEEVNRYLAKGWELYGELKASSGFTQAMVRREPS